MIPFDHSCSKTGVMKKYSSATQRQKREVYSPIIVSVVVSVIVLFHHSCSQNIFSKSLDFMLSKCIVKTGKQIAYRNQPESKT